MNPASKKQSRFQRIRNIVATAAIPAAASAMLLAVTPQAQAASNSYIYTQSGRPHALATCWEACGSEGRPIYPANGTITHMICWGDDGWYDGNYDTNRWFVVTVNGQPGQWFINASYVYYQTTVPACA
jgi:hypothetical protein